MNFFSDFFDLCVWGGFSRLSKKIAEKNPTLDCPSRMQSVLHCSFIPSRDLLSIVFGKDYVPSKSDERERPRS